jgi:hypothetical protein
MVLERGYYCWSFPDGFTDMFLPFKLILAPSYSLLTASADRPAMMAWMEEGGWAFDKF